MLTALLMGLTFGNDFGWTSLRTVLLFAAAIVFGATFVAVEKRTAEPMLDLRLFQNREFSIGAAAGWASYAGSMPISVFMPFYLQNLLSFSPEKVGVVLASGPLTLAFVAPIAGALSDRIGSRVLTSAGLLIASIGNSFDAEPYPGLRRVGCCVETGADQLRHGNVRISEIRAPLWARSSTRTWGSHRAQSAW